MPWFKLKDFARAARKEGVDDHELVDALRRAEKGLIDSEIGKFLIKQRIGRQGQGRATGLWAVLVHKAGTRSVFVHLFPKSSKANLTSTEQDVYRAAAKQLVALTDRQIAALVEAGEWIELHEQDLSE